MFFLRLEFSSQLSFPIFNYVSKYYFLCFSSLSFSFLIGSSHLDPHWVWNSVLCLLRGIELGIDFDVDVDVDVDYGGRSVW
jgi:hypothetical protein